MASEPNDALRRARARVDSPSSPGEPASRQDLAELVNTWVWEHHSRQVELDANYIGKLERGTIRRPQEHYRAALRAVTGATTDRELGFYRRHQTTTTVEPVDRRQFLRTASLASGTLGLTPITSLLDGGEPTPIPARIGATEIKQVRNAASVFESWDFTYGGGLAREAVLAQLRWSAGLLHATCPSRLQGDLVSAVGCLAETAGFMAFDACSHDEARRVFRFALTCAEQADDWHLRAAVLSDMARHAVWVGQPDEGLTFSEQALVRADRLTATERAMLHTTQARAFATMRDREATLAAIGAADEHFADARPDAAPPFMAYYDAAHSAADTGSVLGDLAVAGHGAGEATARLSAAINGYGSTHARSKVIAEVRLASLTMSTGDPAEAARIGIAALEHTDHLRSGRIVALLRELGRRAHPHDDIGEVAQLRNRINALLHAA